MTVNLLTKRLKAARSELTALKTTHTRGIGLLRLYSQILTIDGSGQTGGVHELDVTISLNTSYASFPFVQVSPAINDDNGYTMEIDGFTYTNGYNLRYHLLWLVRANSGDTNKLQIVSSSPITSVNYEWTA